MQLAGELSKVNLASLIRLVGNGELTGKICFTSGMNTGFIYVEQGRVVHAETDQAEGREAILELFLWTGGTFAYSESSLENVPLTLAPDEPVEKILRDGVVYLEAKKFLEQLRINSRTILKAVRPSDGEPILSGLDGKKRLGVLMSELGLTRFVWLTTLHKILGSGGAVVVEDEGEGEEIKLPEWVVSRLRQDNPDVSEAIMQLVIWSDRIKCWLFKADADLEKVIAALGTNSSAIGDLTAADLGSESVFPPGISSPLGASSQAGTSSQADAGQAVAANKSATEFPDDNTPSIPGFVTPPRYEF